MNETPPESSAEPSAESPAESPLSSPPKASLAPEVTPAAEPVVKPTSQAEAASPVAEPVAEVSSVDNPSTATSSDTPEETSPEETSPEGTSPTPAVADATQPTSPATVEPTKSGLPLAMTIGVWAVACLGVLILTVAALSFFPDVTALLLKPTPAATQVVAIPSVIIPTTTPGPTLTNTSPPTAPLPTATATTAAQITATTASTATAAATVGGVQLKVIDNIAGANVRSGPGTNYPIIGGLSAGSLQSVIGRDSTSRWFVIAFADAANGQGWVSGTYVEYSGNGDELPVITAPPPPPATATPKGVPTSPGPVGGRGLVGKLTLCNSTKTTYAVNERICFVEWIKNNTNAAISYGLIGVSAANVAGGGGPFQTSWDAAGIPGGYLGVDANCEGPTDRCKGAWEDGIRISAPGTYRLTLQICYSVFSQCLNGGDWETLSAGIDVVIQ